MTPAETEAIRTDAQRRLAELHAVRAVLAPDADDHHPNSRTTPAATETCQIDDRDPHTVAFLSPKRIRPQ